MSSQHLKNNATHRTAIIILNWNGVDDTVECIESVLNSSYKDFDIVAVDNASSGNDADILKRKFGDKIKLIVNAQNLGFTGGNNVGIEYALKNGYEFVVILNNDTVVHPDFLKHLVSAMNQDPNLGIASSKIVYFFKPDTVQSAGGTIHLWTGNIRTIQNVKHCRKVARFGYRHFVWATCAIVRTSVYERVGLMDPYFFFGVEEYDFCLRVRMHGFKIAYVPESIVWHKAGQSAKRLPMYPETLNKIKKLKGFLGWKFYLRLFSKFIPFPLSILPVSFILSREILALIKGTFSAMAAGELGSRMKKFRERI